MPGPAPRVLSGPMSTCAMMAPTFPDAAEMPWAELRYRVGKHSPGTMTKVQLEQQILASCIGEILTSCAVWTEVEEELG